MDPVLVSAYVFTENHYQNLDFYIQNGVKMLSIQMNKIVFIDNRVIRYFETYKNAQTHIIPFSYEDNYLAKYLPKLQEVTNGNPEKDTNLFYSIMCNKTEWIRKAIQLDIYDSNYFTWFDFGMYKIFNENLTIYSLKKCYDSVRIASIWDLNQHHNVNIHKQVCWYFAGGIFGGNKQSLIQFADIMKHETLRYIQSHNALVWEVNIWYTIYKQYPGLFSPYTCNHNNSIVNNF